MINHFETLVCPECLSIGVALVKHTFPYWTYGYTCNTCNHIITKSEWNSTGKLFHTDMMNVIGQMKSNVPGLIIITDPPFGVRKEEKWDDKELFKRMVKPWLMECLRVAEHTVIWFCACRMYPYIFRAIDEDKFLREHHWKKPPGTQYNGASNNNIWYSDEPILVFTKDRNKTVRNFDRDIPYNYDDLTYDTIGKKTWGHPTTKPVGLMAQLILHYSLPTDTIFDPFGGSGSTVEAAIKLNRKYIYVEQSPLPDKPITDMNGDNPDHFGTALNRIKNLNAQTTLFGVNYE